MAQTRLGNVRKCKFWLWAFSVEGLRNGGAVVIVSPPAWCPTALDERLAMLKRVSDCCGEQACRQETSGPSCQFPCLGVWVDLVRPLFLSATLFIWDWERVGKQNSQKSLSQFQLLNLKKKNFFFISVFARAPVHSKIDCFNFSPPFHLAWIIGWFQRSAQKAGRKKILWINFTKMLKSSWLYKLVHFYPSSELPEVDYNLM